MRVEGSFEVRRDRDAVYAFFTDAQLLMDCLEDPHTVEVTDEWHFSGTITTGIAFIRGTFRMNGVYTERRSPDFVVAKIHGGGLGSGLDGVISTALTESDGVTTVAWTAEISLSGPIASLGERIVRSTIDKKTQSLFQRAQRTLEGRSS
jgi:uncharacterized protein